jgi:hypothetical protein
VAVVRLQGAVYGSDGRLGPGGCRPQLVVFATDDVVLSYSTRGAASWWLLVIVTDVAS